jgi:hypothetical protein
LYWRELSHKLIAIDMNVDAETQVLKVKSVILRRPRGARGDLPPLQWGIPALDLRPQIVLWAPNFIDHIEYRAGHYVPRNANRNVY